ncbi:MAG: flagellar motor protein MotB [Planctomycetaceae bacterium]|nr:flagellar motor protein MotB [Planctomycetaceae bacterium]
MTKSAQFLAGVGFVAICVSQVGCNLVPQSTLRQSQLRGRQLYNQNKSLAVQRAESERLASQMAGDVSKLQSDLDVANQRLQNLQGERSELKDRLVKMINQRNEESPLSADATRRFQQIMEQFPEFQFDPQTGVSKFHSDFLFASGSDKINTKALPVLREFAQIMNAGEARQLKILVVGHTDDKPIAKNATRTRHPTNWHLSTNRANAVVLELTKSGVTSNRLGAAGYSMFQPIVANKDSNSRAQNRRVEIFVLAPDAVVASSPGGRRE